MSNRLIHETSPYLLQHAENPVDWYPWGEEALTRAREEDKLILVSIGYAACHWCHVMEHESFEDPEVAEIMNRDFVCIKVDREERPDIDKIYMDAVTMMTGRGGWPLNCFALPDGRPISGGTYFPKENWMQVLGQLSEVYKNERPKALGYAANLTQAIRNMESLVPIADARPFTPEQVKELLTPWMEQIDFSFGGRNSRGNKFPLPQNNLMLTQATFFLNNEAHQPLGEKVAAAGAVTLEKMALGGIYDHLGGGFARYSVDPYWKVPHFEKMLYDNGQLVSLYAEGYLAGNSLDTATRELYKHVVYQTLEFVERELTSEEGGFYASLDADSEGEEGKFYTWKYEEIEKALGEDTRQFAYYYNVHPHGNWEHTNVLYVLEKESEFAATMEMDAAAFSEKMAQCRKKLMSIREGKIRPGLDDKILASWNALMLKGYVDAYRAFGEDKFLTAAKRNAAFIHEKLSDGGKLFRNYKEGRRTINGFLDDYAFVIDAYLSLYQVTFEEKWLAHAEGHLNHLREHFYDMESRMFYYTSDEDPALVKRHIEVQDDVTPASNSVLAHSLLTLGLILDKKEYRDQARQMLNTVKKNVVANPAWHANWARLMLRYAFPHYEVALTGEQALPMRMEMEGHYHPNRIFAGASEASNLPILQNRFADQTTIYVCEGNACQLPVHSVVEAAGQMKH